jgi:hypothetical protein
MRTHVNTHMVLTHTHTCIHIHIHTHASTHTHTRNNHRVPALLHYCVTCSGRGQLVLLVTDHLPLAARRTAIVAPGEAEATRAGALTIQFGVAGLTASIYDNTPQEVIAVTMRSGVSGKSVPTFFFFFIFFFFFGFVFFDYW